MIVSRYKVGKDLTFQRSAIALTWIWLAVFALVPSFLVFITSLLTPGDNELVRLQLTADNYVRLFHPTYLRVFLRSWIIATICTFVCLCIAYPFSYAIAQLRSARAKGLLMLLVIVPFWTSSLIRSYAIVAMIKARGIVNAFLLWTGIIDQPLQLMYTNMATLIGLIYTLLPLMILPLYVSIDKLDKRLIDAARDLGANKTQIFFKVLLPLTLPGILSGSILVFLPAMTIFYIPDLLGGAKTILLGNIIQNQFLAARDWPMGATISVALTLLISLCLFLYSKHFKKQQDFL
jgi:spermidine/putrescine transport system permease protein